MHKAVGPTGCCFVYNNSASRGLQPTCTTTATATTSVANRADRSAGRPRHNGRRLTLSLSSSRHRGASSAFDERRPLANSKLGRWESLVASERNLLVGATTREKIKHTDASARLLRRDLRLTPFETAAGLFSARLGHRSAWPIKQMRLIRGLAAFHCEGRTGGALAVSFMASGGKRWPPPRGLSPSSSKRLATKGIHARRSPQRASLASG